MSIRHSFDTSIFEITRYTQADPGAGVNFTFTVPANVRISPITIQFDLNTDANAANRQGVIAFNVGGNLDIVISGDPVQTASQGRRHLWSQGVGNAYESIGTQQYYAHLPLGLWLSGGQTISSVIDNMQVGDTISLIRIIAKRQVAE